MGAILPGRIRFMALNHHLSLNRRAAGALLHLTSLPGAYGIGDLGKGAFDFVDWLVEAGVRWWQTLPHTPAGFPPGYSPYSSPSSFAGNPWFVDLDDLVSRGWLDRSDLKAPASFRSTDRVDFKTVDAWRDQRLRIAYHTAHLPASFRAFVKSHATWLDGWALFAAISHHFGTQQWTKWPKDIREKRSGALTTLREKLADEIEYHQFVQWLFSEHWHRLRAYAADKGIGLIGDVPIFVGHGSADVWNHPKLFLLEQDGNARLVSGCPPDGFNPLGQVWNHPHYRWAQHGKDGYAWWVSRFESAFDLYDVVRVDHFLGFHRAWAIPAGAKHAKRGHWLKTPGREILTALKRKLGEVPIIAEDLGTVTREALDLRDEFNLPGMHVMMFAFDGDPGQYPHRYKQRSVAYTGTHDCDTVAGYVTEKRKLALRDRHARQYIDRLSIYAGPEALSRPHQAMTRLLMSSIAETAIVPIQDVLGLRSRARMNVPGTDAPNWDWRLKPGQLNSSHAKHLRRLLELTHRV